MARSGPREAGRQALCVRGRVFHQYLALSEVYGWSRRGKRFYFEVPRNWGANLTLLSSMSLEGMGPSLAVEGSTTKVVFEAYVERVLAPTLKPGQR